MKKLLFLLLFCSTLCVGQTKFIHQPYDSVMSQLQRSYTVDDIDTGRFDDSGEVYIITGENTASEKWFVFNKALICTSMTFKERSNQISVYVARFNAKKMSYEKAKDRYNDRVSKCYWSIKNMPNQKIDVSCIAY